ncbi:hypothetical protein OC861_005553 [Tilletia horrida]|nr:hypothetical protein OC861_005553 [Tilletia horrida]
MLHARGFVDNPYPLQHFVDRLPDYDVAQLRTWMRLYFHKPTSAAYFIQSIVCTVMIVILIACGGVVLIYRLWGQTLWLFRLQETRGASLIIPNSITCFVLFEATYGALWLANVWNNLAIDKWGSSPNYTGFWNGTPWILLFIGAWCGAWGTFFASPGILHKSSRVTGFDARRLIPGPKLCNFIGFFAPFAFTAASLAVSIPTGLTYKHAVQTWQSWDAQAASLNQTEYPVPVDIREEAAQVWKDITDAWWWSSIGWLALLVFAWAFLVFYVFCGGFLLFTIYSQLCMLRAPKIDHQKKDPRQETNPTAAAESPRWDADHAAHEAFDLEMTRAQASTFFPPLAASTMATGPTTRRRRVKMLRSAMVNVSFIYGAISLGTLGFVINLHWLLEAQYEQAALGPVEMNRTYERYMAVASWIASVFGLICFTAISQKTFEGVFEEWSAVREAKKAAAAVQGSQGSSLTVQGKKFPKASSSASFRLKSLKSSLANSLVSQNGSQAQQPPLPTQGMTSEIDPAHADALQHFQRRRQTSLNMLAAVSASDAHEEPNGTWAHPPLQSIRGLGIGTEHDDVSRHGDATWDSSLRKISTLPFDHCRISSDVGEELADEPADAEGVGPTQSTSGLYSGRRSVNTNGIIVQRAVTCTSEDARKYVAELNAMQPSNSSSFQIPTSPGPRSHEDADGSADFRIEESRAERRRQFHRDDSIASFDADLDTLSSDSGSIQPPRRSGRRTPANVHAGMSEGGRTSLTLTGSTPKWEGTPDRFQD